MLPRLIRIFFCRLPNNWKNESVYEIATLLSIGFEPDTSAAHIPTGQSRDDVEVGVYSSTPLGYRAPGAAETVAGTDCPEYLSLLVGKLSAAKIGTVRLGESLSILPNWIRAYRNDVFAQLQRWVVNAGTAEIVGLRVRPNLDLGDVLMKMKLREMSSVELES